MQQQNPSFMQQQNPYSQWFWELNFAFGAKHLDYEHIFEILSLKYKLLQSWHTIYKILFWTYMT